MLCKSLKIYETERGGGMMYDVVLTSWGFWELFEWLFGNR